MLLMAPNISNEHKWISIDGIGFEGDFCCLVCFKTTGVSKNPGFLLEQDHVNMGVGQLTVFF